MSSNYIFVRNFKKKRSDNLPPPQKKKPSEKTIAISVRLNPEAMSILNALRKGSRSQFINRAILEKWETEKVNKK